MTSASNLAVRAVGLSRTFQVGETQVEALRGVNLEVPQGQFVALVGPSGSGKSTFLNLVGGLDRPTGGELWIDGVELGASKEKVLTEHRRRRVGFVFQGFNLLPRLTALENVALPLMFAGVAERDRLARACDLLAQVGLGDRIYHRPTQLSGGEQQRVAIARALVGRPAIWQSRPATSTGHRPGDHGSAARDEPGPGALLLVTHDPEAAALPPT